MAASLSNTINRNGASADKATASEKEHPYLHPSESTPSLLYHGLLGDDIPRLPSVAAEATKNERRLTLASALKLYPKAIGWSAAISFGIVMEGFGTALLNAFYAFPRFQQQYGVRVNATDYEIPTHWQAGLSNAAVGSSIIGILLNGILMERFGYRKTFIACLVFLALSIFAVFFAYTLQILLVGQILCGFFWGSISTLTITYAAEVLPTNLRGFLIASINLCWLLGQIIAQGTLRGFIGLNSAWSYRIPFALQWAFIFIVLILATLAPDSPWWLVQQNRPDAARRVLLRLTRRGADFNPDHAVAMMCHTDEVEKSLASGKSGSSYLECFRGTNLRRTEIACCIFMIQNASGLPVVGFAAYFYNKIGFSQKQSFDLSIGMQGVAIFGAILSFVLMRFVGRRTLYLVGLAVQLVILVVAGTISVFPETDGTLWATAAMIIIFIFVFDIMVGPMTYCVVAEVPSTRLRVKTVALARVAYNLCALVTNVLQTNMLNTLSWGWRGKSCYFWAGSCLICFVYCFFRLPETRGLTYLELDILFEKKAHATKFAEVQKHLADTGYFSLDEDQLERPRWVEAGDRGAVRAMP